MTYDDEARRYAEFLGSRLREECRKFKISQQELADRLGVTPASVNTWFTGKSVPNLWMAVQIADILDLPMDEIFNPRPIAIDYMIPLSVSMESIEKSIDKMSKDQVRGLALLLRGYEIKR